MLLSRKQKAELCILAHQAWMKLGCPGGNLRGSAQSADRLPAEPTAYSLQPTASFEAWRHEQQFRVTGETSLRLCTQRDFLPLLAHFQDLAGHTGTAMNTLIRHQTDGVRRARFMLERNCRVRGLTLAYPDSICRRQFRCGLDEATERQLWNLVFTIRNRRKAQRHDPHPCHP